MPFTYETRTLIKAFVVSILPDTSGDRVPNAMDKISERIRRMPELKSTIHPTGKGNYGIAERGILALVTPERLRRILTKMLDENEFLSPYGIRSISKFHKDNPFVIWVQGQEFRVDYLPAESNTGMFGGNSNWRCPIWMPMNIMILRALLSFYLYYGENFKIECPTGSGNMMNLFEVTRDLSERLTAIFTRNDEDRRPVYGGMNKFQHDPYWRDYILFHEYFHGDNGAGLGASHQTGWTGVVAKIIELFGSLDANTVLHGGRETAFTHRSDDVKQDATAGASVALSDYNSKFSEAIKK